MHGEVLYVSGLPAWVSDSKFGKALDFSGTPQYTRLTKTPLTATPFTISCWGLYDTGALDMSLVSIGDADTSNNYWMLWFNDSSGTVYGSVRAIAGGGPGNANTTTTCTLGKWHHLAGVFRSSTYRAVYLDGGGLGTDTTNLTPTGVDNVTIGATPVATPTLNLYGRIAEVAIWNRELSVAEIKLLAKNPFILHGSSIIPYFTKKSGLWKTRTRAGM